MCVYPKYIIQYNIAADFVALMGARNILQLRGKVLGSFRVAITFKMFTF